MGSFACTNIPTEGHGGFQALPLLHAISDATEFFHALDFQRKLNNLQAFAKSTTGSELPRGEAVDFLDRFKVISSGTLERYQDLEKISEMRAKLFKNIVSGFEFRRLAKENPGAKHEKLEKYRNMSDEELLAEAREQASAPFLGEENQYSLRFKDAFLTEMEEMQKNRPTLYSVYSLLRNTTVSAFDISSTFSSK